MKLEKENGLPTLIVEPEELPISLVDCIVALGFAKSKREARYLIKAGAIKLGQPHR